MVGKIAAVVVAVIAAIAAVVAVIAAVVAVTAVAASRYRHFTWLRCAKDRLGLAGRFSTDLASSTSVTVCCCYCEEWVFGLVFEITVPGVNVLLRIVVLEIA